MLDVLRTFPSQCKNEQLDTLDQLPWSAIRYDAGDLLLDLAASKLSLKRMNAGQRIRWLGVGLICSPDDYREAVAALSRRGERSVRHLARFLIHGAGPLRPSEGA